MERCIGRAEELGGMEPPERGAVSEAEASEVRPVRKRRARRSEARAS